MVNRIATWAILIWTALMAVGIVAAYMGIGGDCVGLTGTPMTVCQADAWARGVTGLALLAFLWLVVAVAIGAVWMTSRPKANPG